MVGAHGKENPVQAHRLGYIGESAVAEVPEKLWILCVFGSPSERGSPDVPEGFHSQASKASDEQILVSVVVVIPEPGGKAPDGLLNPGDFADVSKVAPAIPEEEVRFAIDGNEKILPTVIVHVPPGRACRRDDQVESQLVGGILEGTVSVVPVKLTRMNVIAHRKIANELEGFFRRS